VSTPVRRAVAFAVVGTIALLVPVVTTGRSPALATVLATAPFIAIAALAIGVVRSGMLFELFARPGDRRDGRLYGLAGYALAIAGLALLSAQFGLPVPVFVTTVLVLAYGKLAGKLVGWRWPDEVLAMGGFVAGGILGGSVGGAFAAATMGQPLDGTVLALLLFLAASGALVAALLRTVLFERDDPLVLVTVGLLLWLFADLPLFLTLEGVAVALAITLVLAGLSYVLQLGSLPGLLTGVLLSLLTIVLGDLRWFAVLVTFFGIGGVAASYRYEEKLERGVAEDNEGARGSGNVLANSIVALLAVLAAAASPSHTGIEETVFLFAFAGAVAAAMSDTLSSEIGGLFDAPRMITTFETVAPGTDGAVTWQGELAGIVGASVVAIIAGAGFGRIGLTGGALVLIAGLLGMTVDSLLGATIEGRYVENEGVNTLATLAAAVVAAVAAAVFGLA
jgi:uncharacterized protein (TIGR00297 family)